MNYVKIEDGVVVRYPTTQADMRRDNPNISFPSGALAQSIMEQFGCYPVITVTIPTHDSVTQYVIEGAPSIVAGVWTQTWQVIDYQPDEMEQRIREKWSDIRDTRNELLAASDWTQLADAPVDPFAWITYREALRDITLQADPFNLTWPVAP